MSAVTPVAVSASPSSFPGTGASRMSNACSRSRRSLRPGLDHLYGGHPMLASGPWFIHVSFMSGRAPVPVR